MKKLTCVLTILLLTGFATIQSHAKRGAPKDVAPVTHKGVVYSAPHDQMGCVIAKNEKNGHLIFNKQIYVVRFDTELEKDVQDCFITELKIDGDKLLISNERGGQFELNLANLTVKVLKGADLVERAK